MFKRIKIAYKKINSFLFGQEIEHIHTREERKKYYGRVKTDQEAEAKMIHQYPKEGKFRFPLPVDDKQMPSRFHVEQAKSPVLEQVVKRDQVARVSNEVIKRESPSRGLNQATKRDVASHAPKQQPKEKVKEVEKPQEKKKFQGVNFKARQIPSPVYAYNQHPSKQLTNDGENETNEMELKEPVIETMVEQKEQLKEEINISKLEIFDNEVEKLAEEVVNEEETVFLEEVESQEQTEELIEIIEPTQIEEMKEQIDEVLVEEVPHNILEKEEVQIESHFDFQSEVAAATIEIDEIESNKMGSLHEQQLEQKQDSMNTMNNLEDKVVKETAKETTKETAKETVFPFNVLMFHKDRVALKEQEEKKKKTYQFPTLQLLNIPPRQSEDSSAWLEEKKEILELTLANFNVQAKVVGVTRGPSVTRFEIQPEPGVKVSKVTSLTDDIKLSLAAKDIRMEAPIPGKNAIGIEVPNNVSDPVVIREILRSSEFQKNPSPLTVAMGLDIEGKPIVTDIQKMPHGLIAGATGSGKSVCINSILISIMFKATPDEVKLMLVDPKMVELAPYNDIPHLVTPVITDAKQATVALKWAVEEMERRYELFVQNGVRDIKRYNEVMRKDDDPIPALPYIVIVIDELADLMMVSPHDVEEAICRIAQKARACGIHLLLATQRPSVDVITGLIKANIPTRVAFSVSSQVDSRTIIDSGGAERLLGKGDMLLFENGASKPVRVQGNFVSDEEIDRVISLVKQQRKPNYLFDKESLVKSYEATGDQEDDLFEDACYYVLEQGGASSSSLQRKFRIGFNRAARLIDMMEARGIISEAMGSKPRNVLVSEEELTDRM